MQISGQCGPGSETERVALEFIIVVIGIILIFEGLPWFLSPTHAKKVLLQLAAFDNRTLRGIGFTFMALGLLLVYLVRG